MQQRVATEDRATFGPGPLVMVALAIPLFFWNAFNTGFFAAQDERIIIPLAVFLGGPILMAAAVWAYARADTYLATATGALGGFWLSYGMLLWLDATHIIPSAGQFSALRGLLFAVWTVSLAVIWIGSMREHWTLGLVTLGATVMFLLLAIGSYTGADVWLRIGGWAGFVTAVIAWYAALAEMLNTEYHRVVLPTDTFMRPHFRSQ